jgi:hypothetical protein
VAGIDGATARPTVEFGVLTGKKKREGKRRWRRKREEG